MVRFKSFVGGALLALALSGASAQTLPTNNDPSNQIRFDTPAEADAKRAQLTNFIWSSGLPVGSLPTVTSGVGAGVFSGDLNGITSSLVSSVSRLDANVSAFDFFSKSYLLTPVNTSNANRVVIVHQGHSPSVSPLDSGLGNTVNSLLQQGYTVNVMQQPLFGWNNDNTAVVPGQGLLTYGTQYDGHAEMISNTGPANGGMGFRLFLEPVVQSINYFQTLPGLIDVSMIGISGGAWTTQFISAIDTRVKTSIPVAGSAPLYFRNTDPNSVGDLEQFYSPMFDENIAADGSGGGVATWMELYVLGAYGPGRHSVMVTNLNDPCCFSGTFVDSFDDIVAASVAQLGQGAWTYYLDSTSSIHQITQNTLDTVLFPALQAASLVPEAPTAAMQLCGLAMLAVAVRRRSRASGSSRQSRCQP